MSLAFDSRFRWFGSISHSFPVNCYSAVCRIASHRSTLPTLSWSTLPYARVHYTTLRNTALFCTVLLRYFVVLSTSQLHIAQYRNATLHGTALQLIAPRPIALHLTALQRAASHGIALHARVTQMCVCVCVCTCVRVCVCVCVCCFSA